MCNYLGIPLALEKVEGPSTALSFLGIMLNTITMEAKLPEEKLRKLRVEVSQWVHRTSARKREILSLVGSLQYATKVVRCGRAFVSCIKLFLRTCQNSLETEMLTEEKFAKRAMVPIMIMFAICVYSLSDVYTCVVFDIL